MEIRAIHLGLIKTNCYLISTDKAAVVIDPGFKTEITADFLKANEGKARMILITHAHFDHIGGAEALRAETGVEIGIGEFDAPALKDTELNLSDKFHANIAPFSADRTFCDGEKFSVGDIDFEVILTPGHTVGGVSYLSGESLFSGDTLFAGAVGRTDMPGGSLKALKKSLKRLIALPEDTKVYPGHGDFTTVGYEKENNMFVW